MLFYPKLKNLNKTQQILIAFDKLSAQKNFGQNQSAFTIANKQ